MAPTTGSEISSARVEMEQQRRRSNTGSALAKANNPRILTDTLETSPHQELTQEEDDRDDKSWRTRGESSPSLASALASPPRSLADSLSLAPRRWDTTAGSPSSPRPERRKRQLFWRNVMRQYNFVHQEDERALVLSLTDGIDWTTMALLPRQFMARHKEIYYLICRGDYERSSTIQRDVTRTFSIFERSQLPKRERDVDAQQRALFRVLNAVAEAEDGYCQGMNFIAALFLVEGLDEADAYALFLYLLRKRQLARIYHHSSTFLDDYLVHFERMFQRELPDLYAHMHAQGFAIPMYGIEWFTTLFSLSTKPDLACAIFDLFFVGVQDIFLRMGLAVLKLLEAPLMCMSFEDFLRDFKPLVRQIDPYHAVLQALAFRPNSHVTQGEDTTVHIARIHYMRAAAQGSAVPTTTPDGATSVPRAPRAFLRHRSLPPEMAGAIETGDFAQVSTLWLVMTAQRETMRHWLVLANEMLHFAVWHGHVAVALFAIRQCGADVDNADDTALTPLHFAVIRDQPDLVRVLLCFGADGTTRGGRWSGTDDGLTPLETAFHWKFRDTSAARLVLEGEVCLCCNTKFDAFAFHRETCRKCRYTYCGRGTEPCIARHQCPHVYRRWRQRQRRSRPQRDLYDDDASTFAVGEDTIELAPESINAAASESAGSAPSSSSSRRSSRSTSEASSSQSFVFINSPARDLPTDRPAGFKTSSSTSTEGGIQVTTAGGTQGSAGLLGSLVGWLSGGESAPREDDDLDDLMSADAGRGIDFPDRPDWYCNAPECHAVFSFFSRGEQCTLCGGLFCANDFDSRSRQCQRCKESHVSFSPGER